MIVIHKEPKIHFLTAYCAMLPFALVRKTKVKTFSSIKLSYLMLKLFVIMSDTDFTIRFIAGEVNALFHLSKN